jgi:hypothetical protein
MPLLRNALRFLSLLVLLSSGPDVSAADEGALAKLRVEFEAALARHAVEPLKQHLAELEALETKAAAARDWATALACREAHQQATAELASVEKVNLLTADETRKGSAEIRLPLALAKLEGVRFDLSAGLLKDWLSVGSSAQWTLPDIAPGGYEVTLRYASSATQGGAVIAEEAHYTLSAATKITLNGPESHMIGTLRIRDGRGPFRLRVGAVSKSGLMDLVEVILTPANN